MAAQLDGAEKQGNQAASLEARLRVIGNERKTALEQVSFYGGADRIFCEYIYADDLPCVTYEAKKVLADDYLDVLMSLKEKWEKKKAVANRETRLQEVLSNIDLLKEIIDINLLASDELSRLWAKEVELGAELDVTAVSDFFVGKIDFGGYPGGVLREGPFWATEPGGDSRRSDGQYEDGEFDDEERL